jgi:hypothetical protein
MTSPDKHIVSFQIDSELKASLHKLAEADNRSLSSYIKLLLQAHVESTRSKRFRGPNTSGTKKAVRS